MKVATLMRPAVLICKPLKPPQSVGNKRSNVVFDMRRYYINRFTPRLVPFSSAKQYRIEKVHTMIVYRLHGEDIQHPLSASKAEVYAVNDERIWPVR